MTLQGQTTRANGAGAPGSPGGKRLEAPPAPAAVRASDARRRADLRGRFHDTDPDDRHGRGRLAHTPASGAAHRMLCEIREVADFGVHRAAFYASPFAQETFCRDHDRSGPT